MYIFVCILYVRQHHMMSYHTSIHYPIYTQFSSSGHTAYHLAILLLIWGNAATKLSKALSSCSASSVPLSIKCALKC